MKMMINELIMKDS